MGIDTCNSTFTDWGKCSDSTQQKLTCKNKNGECSPEHCLYITKFIDTQNCVNCHWDTLSWNDSTQTDKNKGIQKDSILYKWC